jgi:hypothetical protein
LQKDVFRMEYDAKKLTPEKILEAVRKEGFEGEFLPDGSPR